MDEIKVIREALEYLDSWRYAEAIDDLNRLETRDAELIKDRDYWQALAMQFHDAVHAEIERRAKVEI